MNARGAVAALCIPLCLAACSPGASWRARLAGPDPTRADAALPGVAVDADGDVIVASALEPAGEEVEAALLVTKLSGASGATLWRRPIGGGAAEPALVVAAGRDPVVGGELAGFDGGESAGEARIAAFAVLRIDGRTGGELWRYAADPVGASERAGVTALALDPRGEVIAAGFRTSEGATHMAVIKLAASDGRRLWRYGGRVAGVASAIVTTREGDVVVAGTAQNPAGGHDLLALKLDGLDGAELWRRSIASSGAEETPIGEVRALALARSGDVIAARLFSTADGSLLLAARIDARSGDVRWSERIAAGSGAQLELARDGRDQILATATSPAGLGVLKLAAADGRELWRQTLAAGSSCAEGVAVSVDARDDVIAAGCEAAGRASVLKLRGRDGRPVWQSGIGAGIGRAPYALALDASGDVVIARYVASSERRAELVVTKLRGRDGRTPPPDALEAEASPTPGVSSRGSP